MPSTKKAETHERIVEQASRALRRSGYDGVSVADIMKEAGLTHGGFYAHFESRDDLVVEALERAAADSLAGLTTAMDAAPAGAKLETFLERYLSDAHVRKAESGCSLVALGSETRRQPAAVRAVAKRQVKTLLALIEKTLPKGKEDRADEARVILSAVIRSLILARAIDDGDTSRALRASVKRFASRH